MPEDRPIRVAIIGGGCAGMTTAFELSRPEHQGKYEITLYQRGFRLGGKGASGRGVHGRIEEHGLHVWMGYYENAFRLMRECYAELGRDQHTCPIADISSAFVPANFVAAADRLASGAWTTWRVEFPTTPGLPGEPGAETKSQTVAEYLVHILGLVRTLLETARRELDDGKPAATSEPLPLTSAELGATIARLLQYGALAGLGAALELLRVLEFAMSSALSVPDNLLLQLLDRAKTAAQQQLEAYLRPRDELRRIWAIADMLLACVRGSLRHRLLTDPRGFEALDDYDCREWLLSNGASPLSLQSPFVRSLYDLGFAYEDGDVSRPRIAAGAGLRGFLRSFFTYRGAFFWKMTAGMGDIVFAPLYQVLARRGVRFEFFHRLENVGLANAPLGTPAHVSSLRFDVQCQLRDPDRGYQPLVDHGGLPCFPAAPDYDQLIDGERLRGEAWDFDWHADKRKVASKELLVGRDFDLVVLAVGVGAIPYVCAELLKNDARWRNMVEHVKTTATKAFQVWLKADAGELGWSDEPVSLSGFVEPFDTWADMTHLAVREQWPVAPRSIAYFCSVLSGDETLLSDRAAATRAVRREAVEFLNRDIVQLWPRACSEPGRFRWELLQGGDDSQPADARRFDSQYVTANVDPSERFTLSLPGSLKYRISPLDRSYDNLTVAGDWTDCGLNLACVEAAVMSGLLAAHALSRSPALSQITGYDHP